MPPINEVGFWGPPTSNIDWCENNYEVTYYIAEFWNTISNIVLILLPFYAVYTFKKTGHEKRILLTFLFFTLVGLGSWCFHMTLLYEMQLLDEMPMLLVVLTAIYCQLTVLWPSVNDSKVKHFGSIVLLQFYGLLSTYFYVVSNIPTVFQSLYGALVLLMTVFNYWISYYRPSRGRLARRALYMYTLAVTVWLIDYHYCEQLQTIRESLPSFLSPFFQLHAVWHVLSGFSGYYAIVFVVDARARVRSKNVTLKRHWYGVEILFNETVNGHKKE